jgi:hypothetical protein
MCIAYCEQIGQFLAELKFSGHVNLKLFSSSNQIYYLLVRWLLAVIWTCVVPKGQNILDWILLRLVTYVRLSTIVPIIMCHFIILSLFWRVMIHSWELIHFIENRCWQQTNNPTVWQMGTISICHCHFFPYICGNIPVSPAYGVYISQLIWYARACSTYDQFLSRGRLLTDKLMLQGFLQSHLMSVFNKFSGCYYDLICSQTFIEPNDVWHFSYQ